MNVVEYSDRYGYLQQIADLDPDLYMDIDKVFVFGFPLSHGLMFFTDDRRTFVYGENPVVLAKQCSNACASTRGRKKRLRRICGPRELETFRGKRIVKVYYHRHIMVQTDDDELYGWGHNDYGALGPSRGQYVYKPKLVMNQVDLVATNLHTLILKKNGDFLCFGYNAFQQVNPEFRNKVIDFQTVYQFEGKPIEIGCSSRASFVFTDLDYLYYWGTIKDQQVNSRKFVRFEGNLVKMLVLEDETDFNVKLLILNDSGDVYMIVYQERINEFVRYSIFSSETILEIYGGRHLEFAIFDMTYCKYSILTEPKINRRTGELEYKYIDTGLRSMIDVERFHRRSHFRCNEPSKLMNYAGRWKYTGSPLRYKLKARQNNIVISWDELFSIPPIHVDYNIIAKFPPLKLFIDELGALCWKQPRDLCPIPFPPRYCGSDGFEFRTFFSRYRLDRKPYPSYHCMYAFLVFLKTKKVVMKYEQLYELTYLASVLRNGHLELMTNFLQKHGKEIMEKRTEHDIVVNLRYGPSTYTKDISFYFN